MKVTKQEIRYNGYNCIRITNGTLELVIPIDFGPRILHFSFVGEKNLFGIIEDVEFKNKYGVWKIYGGHRLWTAPESLETYYPDNTKVDFLEKKDYFRISKNFEKIGIRKEIYLKFISKNELEVIHRLVNISKKTKKISLWTLSVMCKGGMAILPQNDVSTDKYGFLPNRNIVFWKYTDVKDKRLSLDNDFIYIKQDTKSKTAFKIGQFLLKGWISYKVDKYLMVKKFKTPLVKTLDVYPDFFCNVEIYSCPKFLELELLTPLKVLNKSESIQHNEIWQLYKDN
ncbi:MAG: hypothetical protein ABDH23_02285 [Endomicrobiia bacterium]